MFLDQVVIFILEKQRQYFTKPRWRLRQTNAKLEKWQYCHAALVVAWGLLALWAVTMALYLASQMLDAQSTLGDELTNGLLIIGSH